RGLAALEEASPNLVFLAPPDDRSALDRPTLEAAAAWCEAHRAFLIVDPDPSWSTSADALAGVAALGVASPNAALYFPRLLGPGGGDAGTMPPSGAVAGVYARTDAASGVWRAPAGMSAKIGSRVELPLTDADSGVLNPRAINAIRELSGLGTVIWGGRTLAGSVTSGSEWRYVAVRRLAIFIEQSIDEGTRWAVFEPNGEPLWGRIRRTVAEFLRGLLRAGAFPASRPQEAFFVKVDAETTTQADIQAGRVNVLVGIAPLYPAEFVVIRIQQLAGQPRS
ncbi:MAG: phage tail sheath subtilisin-like domain-containing protein, partial [Thermoanaerobaculia bacterium]|nr:phage tail sheath subtilisin-like domain-containing protein [Thermoanaerobaculia bacterium]